MDRENRLDPGRNHGLGTRRRLHQNPQRGRGASPEDQRDVAGHDPVPGNTRLENEIAAAHVLDEGIRCRLGDTDPGRTQSHPARVYHCPQGHPLARGSLFRRGTPPGPRHPERICLVHPGDARCSPRQPVEDFRDRPGLPTGPDDDRRGTAEASHLRERIRHPGHYPAVGPGRHAGSEGGSQKRQSRPVFRGRLGAGIPSARHGRRFRVPQFQGRCEGLQDV
mmetsp:Transcript_20453/g.42691  ORF Transcript_20453/g.42691 Transcript_20453/m.42691 type:complete len:222 (+) Transcript_20453:974-1639(+)